MRKIWFQECCFSYALVLSIRCPLNFRSKSLSDIQMENAAREQERDERNLRYEEMQKLKEMLREEEETWTSVRFFAMFVFSVCTT